LFNLADLQVLLKLADTLVSYEKICENGVLYGTG